MLVLPVSLALPLALGFILRSRSARWLLLGVLLFFINGTGCRFIFLLQGEYRLVTVVIIVVSLINDNLKFGLLPHQELTTLFNWHVHAAGGKQTWSSWTLIMYFGESCLTDCHIIFLLHEESKLCQTRF